MKSKKIGTNKKHSQNLNSKYYPIFNSEDSEQLYRKLSVVDAFRGEQVKPGDDLDLDLRAVEYTVDESKLYKKLPDLLKDPQTGRLHRGITERVTQLIGESDTMSFPLALLFSQVQLDRIEQDTGLSVKSATYTEASFHILPVHKAYSNCPLSEDYLSVAMGREEVVSVYGGLLVKNIGHNVGLCYKAVTDGNRTFIPGFWYGSCGSLKSELREVIKSGIPEFAPSVGVWVLSRPCNNGNILDEVNSYLNRT